MERIAGWLLAHPDLLVAVTGVTAVLAVRNLDRAVQLRGQLRWRAERDRRASEALGG